MVDAALKDIPIALLDRGWDVAPLLRQLDAHPELWNQHTMRTDVYRGPHTGISDIWVRYNPWANFTGDIAAFNAEHTPEWYPCIAAIPGAWALARRVQRHFKGQLGGVLITRIPPGEAVKPHIDRGWHAEVHRKYAVQLRGDRLQAFHFDRAELRPEPGDVYTFDNSQTHWVTNDSDLERITLIVCLR